MRAPRGLAVAVAGLVPWLAAAEEIGRTLDAGACFRRDYDAAHLTRHPDQRVTTIAVSRDTTAPETRLLVLAVRVSLRDSGEIFAGTAYCEPRGAGLSCGMEGDAGGFTLTPAKGGAVLLTVGPDGMGFEGAMRFAFVSGTSGDDRVFRLPAALPARCAFLR